jgi:hypothetical protein
MRLGNLALLSPGCSLGNSSSLGPACRFHTFSSRRACRFLRFSQRSLHPGIGHMVRIRAGYFGCLSRR